MRCFWLHGSGHTRKVPGVQFRDMNRVDLGSTFLLKQPSALVPRLVSLAAYLEGGRSGTEGKDGGLEGVQAEAG